MSSSSRSIAAARQKRAGEQSQPMNNSRPVTSISSSSSFAQQYQQPRGGQNIQVGGKNGRASQVQNRGPETNYKSSQQQPAKISVSNAVGLITLRLGKLEQFINDMHSEEGFMNANNSSASSSNSIPSNMKLVSDEVFENIVNRITLLESKLLNSKNMESSIEKLNKEMSEMKGVLANIHNSLFNFINETNEKFTDVENALALIEENAQINIEDPNDLVLPSDNIDTDVTDGDNVVLEYAENDATIEHDVNDQAIENMIN
jgi:hypothetical protein